jgi:hypothetical protein
MRFVHCAVAGALLAVLMACSYKDNPDTCSSDQECGSRVCNRITLTCEIRYDSSTSADRPLMEQPDADVDHPTPFDGGAGRDATPECLTSPDCMTNTRPICLSGKCVSCKEGPENSCRERDATKAFCSPSGTCTECTSSADCKNEATPICFLGTCVGCKSAAADACSSKDPKFPACGTEGRCVECIGDSGCSGVTPICLQNRCSRCQADEQCRNKSGADPGVCMSHEDGRCAADTEAIYVKNALGCSPTNRGFGTASSPFCFTQDALGAVAPSKRLIVMRGPDRALDRINASVSGPAITIVGQNSATISPGGGVGVQISAGDVFIRNLQVKGGSSTGVVVERDGTLHMNRSTIESNGAGGIQVNGGGYEITNTVIANNDAAPIAVGSPTFFGGVLLSGSGGKPQRFGNNTVVGNKGIGIYCSGMYEVKGVLVHGNANLNVFGCQTIASKVGEEPQFDSGKPFRLTTSSPCRDFMERSDAPTDDIDGQARPAGAKSDCGADEYSP